MRTNFVIRILIDNIKSIFSQRIMVLIILTFSLLYYLQIPLINSYSVKAVSDIYKLCFYGVNTISENLISFLSWMFFELLFFLIAINFLICEFKGRNIYLISRMGDKFKWFSIIELTLLSCCIIYFFIGFLSILAHSIFSSSIKFTCFNFMNIFNVFMTLCLNNFLYLNIYLLLLLNLKNSNTSIIILISLIIIFIDLGYIFNLDLYNPLTQCIMAKHYTNNISFSQSTITLLLYNTLTYILLYFKIVKNDLLNLIH